MCIDEKFSRMLFLKIEFYFNQIKTIVKAKWVFKKVIFYGLKKFNRSLVSRMCLISENKEVYEGEVTEISPVETENPAGGFTKTVSHVVLGLKSAKGKPQILVKDL